MPIAVFPIIGHPLSEFLQGDRFQPVKNVFPDWLFHLKVDWLDNRSSMERYHREVAFLKDDAFPIYHLDLIRDRLELGASGTIYFGAQELTTEAIRRRVWDPEVNEPLIALAPQQAIIGRSFELALAVGMYAARNNRLIPHWMAFTGQLALQPAKGLPLEAVDGIPDKVVLGLGGNGYERCDLVGQPYRLNEALARDLMGPYDQRTRPGRVKLMFVPDGNLADIPAERIRHRTGMTLTKCRDQRAHLEGFLDQNYGTGPGTMLVVGVTTVAEVLAVVFGDSALRSEDVRLDCRLVSLAPPPAAVVSGRGGANQATVVLGSVPIVFCRVPSESKTVIAMAQDVVSRRVYAAVTESLAYRGMADGHDVYPGHMQTDASTARQRVFAWMDGLSGKLGKWASAKPSAVRLPTKQEMFTALTDDELASPSTFARIGQHDDGLVGSEQRPPIQPNAHGLYDLLGNFPQLIADNMDHGTPWHMFGWRFDDHVPASRKRQDIPDDVFADGRMREWSFRPVLEFQSEAHWQAFVQALES